MQPISDQLNDLPLEQQSFIVAWVSENFTPTAAINYRHTAYGLKQPFTRLFLYVTEAQFTEAMRRAGFLVEKNPRGKDCFNISERSSAFKIFRTKALAEPQAKEH